MEKRLSATTAAIAVSIFALGLSACAVGPQSYPTHSFEVLADLARNPAADAGRLYAFRGDVLWVQEAGHGTTFQVLRRHAGTGESYSLLCYFNAQGTGLRKGDLVEVLGTPTGTVAGTNAFGGYADAIGFETYAFQYAGSGTGPSRSASVFVKSRETEARAWAKGVL